MEDKRMESAENLLDWRPKAADEKIPGDVFCARMALLSERDAAAMKKEFDSGRDPIFRYLWFGGDMFGNLGSNSSATMTRCAYVGVDRETTLRLFKASAYGPMVEEKYVPQMLGEAMEFVGEFREEMSRMRKQKAPHARPRFLSHGDDKGNSR